MTDDPHVYQALAIRQAQGMSQAQPDRVRSIAELLDRIRQRAAQTPAGGWIRTATTWDESNLCEKRLPTAAEIDRVASDHPVWIRRGGHIGAANSLALKLAGITLDTPDPQFGQIQRGSDRLPSGVLVAGPAWSLSALSILAPQAGW